MNNPMIHLKNKKTHIIGLGGAGSNLLEHFHTQNLNAQFTYITHPKRLHIHTDIQYIPFKAPGESLLKDGKEILFIPQMDEPLIVPNELKELCVPDEHYVLLAGLGGYTGTYLLEWFIQTLQTNGFSFQVLCSVPFTFEKSRRNVYAEKILKQFQHLPNFKAFELDEMRASFGNSLIEDAFHQMNEVFFKFYIS